MRERRFKSETTTSNPVLPTAGVEEKPGMVFLDNCVEEHHHYRNYDCRAGTGNCCSVGDKSDCEDITRTETESYTCTKSESYACTKLKALE